MSFFQKISNLDILKQIFQLINSKGAHESVSGIQNPIFDCFHQNRHLPKERPIKKLPHHYLPTQIEHMQQNSTQNNQHDRSSQGRQAFQQREGRACVSGEQCERRENRTVEKLPKPLPIWNY